MCFRILLLCILLIAYFNVVCSIKVSGGWTESLNTKKTELFAVQQSNQQFVVEGMQLLMEVGATIMKFQSEKCGDIHNSFDNVCSGHGTCSMNTCTCEDGYSGVICQDMAIL